MTDSFLEFIRKTPPRVAPPKGTAVAHAERKHSKYSASGAERWFACPGSVALSEGMPDKPSVWSLEGTKAHEVLEALLRIELSGNDSATIAEFAGVLCHDPEVNAEMRRLANNAVRFIFDVYERCDGYAEILCEQRLPAPFHPEAFGTFDAGVVEHFGTLHAIDYKYGAGHAVSAVENLQMIFYAIALAEHYDWNFARVRVWIIQPRVRGYDGPTFWDVSLRDLDRVWLPKFERAVKRVEEFPDLYVEGSWCHWCKAKSVCPLKVAAKVEKAQTVFGGLAW